MIYFKRALKPRLKFVLLLYREIVKDKRLDEIYQQDCIKETSNAIIDLDLYTSKV